jgi:eukaryotic-like serine/threonine-protein kinase
MTFGNNGLSTLTFGDFRLDPANLELHKHGLRIHLAQQPGRILAMLASRSREIVTREELRRELWCEDTFVDFEHGLNNCIKQVRAALNDDAANPRYIETIPRRGYRFMAPVEAVKVAGIVAEPAEEVQAAGAAADAAVADSGSVKRHGKVNWIAVGAVALLVGLAATLYEAREQRVRADARFKDLRAVANSLMFDVHDSIQDLPGSTPARKLVVERALAQLDNLARDAGSDASLQRDLAMAYEKAGTVQGNPFGANLGDTQGALNGYRKALGIRQSLLKANPNSIDETIALARVERLTGAVLANRGEPDSVRQLKVALETAEQASRIAPSNPAVLQELQASYYLLAVVLDGDGDYQAAVGYLRKELPIAEDRARGAGGDRALRREPGRVEAKLGYALARMGSRKEGMEHTRRGIQVLETLAADETDAESSRWLGMAHWMMGDILLMESDAAGARRNYEEQRRIAKALAEADPANAVIQYDLGCASARAGNANALAGNQASGLEMMNQAAGMLELQLARDPAYTEPRYCLAASFIWMGEALGRMGEDGRALESYQKGLAIWKELAGHAKGTAAEADVALFYARMGAALAKLGKGEAASQEYERALGIVEPIAAADTSMIEAQYVVADAYSGLGELSQILASDGRVSVQQRMRYWSEARAWYQRSLDVWGRMLNPGARTPVGFASGNRRRVARELASCDAALGAMKRRELARAG